MGLEIFSSFGLEIFNSYVTRDWVPSTDDTYDLGSSSKQWKDLYIDGTAYIDRTSYGDAGSLTISSGAITVTKSYHEIVVEGSTGAGADELTTINGGVDGAILIIRAATSGANDTVTVIDGSNLALAGNFIMDNIEDTLTLLYDTGQSKWLEISRSSNA